MVEEVQTRANAITNLLDDINVNLEMLGEQRAVIDHVGEKLARLDFMVQEAQNTLRALQREREVAERIEQGIKSLRAQQRPRARRNGQTQTKVLVLSECCAVRGDWIRSRSPTFSGAAQLVPVLQLSDGRAASSGQSRTACRRRGRDRSCPAPASTALRLPRVVSVRTSATIAAAAFSRS